MGHCIRVLLHRTENVDYGQHDLGTLCNPLARSALGAGLSSGRRLVTEQRIQPGEGVVVVP